MGDDRQEAIHLAQYYFGLIARQAGLNWEGDNNVEIELLIEYIIGAAAREAKRDA